MHDYPSDEDLSPGAPFEPSCRIGPMRSAAWLFGFTRFRGASLPIWSCSVWGLPCRRHYCRRGALLPHLFTLATALANSKELPRAVAVSFLWH
jgi:hypothetical protein